MMTVCASTPPNRSHKCYPRQENYPVPLQCVSRSRHLLPSSLSFDEGNSTLSPIQFDDGTKKKKPLMPTGGSRSRGSHGHHRRWGSASSALISANNTIPPLYIPYVPPPTINATTVSSRPTVPPPPLPRKKKKKTDSQDPGGAFSLEKGTSKEAFEANEEVTSPTVVFRSKQQQPSTTRIHENHVRTTTINSHSTESNGGGISQSSQNYSTHSTLQQHNEDTINIKSTTTHSSSPPKIMQALVQGVVHVVETVQERHRKASSRKRISQALLTLRAAALIQQQHEQQELSQQDDKEEQSWSFNGDHDDSESDDEHDLDLRELGTVLFYPLDQQRLVERHRNGHRRHHHHPGHDSPKTPTTSKKNPFTQNEYGTLRSPRSVTEPMASRPKKNKDPSSSNTEYYTKKDDNVDDASVDDGHADHDIPKPPPVHILPEPELSCNPRLLSDDMFQQLIDEGVPECLHLNAWERIFSIGRDGDAFDTFLERCSNYKQTILAMKTTTGHILGGFVSDPWQEQDGYTQKHSYYGTGMSFLFANHPVLLEQEQHDKNRNSTTSSSPLTIFPWTGSNDFCQICDKDRNILAMGGSGAFGFILEDDFYVGSTDHCGTFANPPLTPDKDGMFHVAAMEVYGIVPYGLLEQLDKPIASSPRAKANVFDLDPKFNRQSLLVHSEDSAVIF